MSTMVGQFISVTEAAVILGCTPGRVRQMLRADDLPGMKLNEKAWALRRSDVEKAAKKTPETGRPRTGNLND